MRGQGSQFYRGKLEQQRPGLKSVFSIGRGVETCGHHSWETSHSISSRNACPKQLIELAQEHWKVEPMQWILDVTFSEDDCCFLTENAHKSMNTLRKFALAVHKDCRAHLHNKSSMKAHMLSALLASHLFLSTLHFL